MPELPFVTYRGNFEGGAHIADASGRVLARRDGSAGSGYVVADVDARRSRPARRGPRPLLAAPPRRDRQRHVEHPAAARPPLVRA